MNRKHHKTKSGDKLRFSEKLSRTFDVPLEGVENVGIVEIKGTGEVIVNGCSGILQYDPETILLRSGRKIIKIVGRRMTMMTFTNSCASVEGRIEAVYPDVSLTSSEVAGGGS